MDKNEKKHLNYKEKCDRVRDAEKSQNYMEVVG